MLNETLREIMDAIKTGDKRTAERLIRVLERAGMDRYTIYYLLKSGAWKEEA